MQKKICFAASSGGHWEELMCLKKIADENFAFYVTEKGGQIQDMELEKLYTFAQISRKEKLFIFHFVWVMLRSLYIMLKERPDVVIATGALITFPFCFYAKLLGKKVIFIESFARVHDTSLTGRIVYKFADLFIVQWESLLKCYPNAVYAGSIF